jgi:ribosomal protein L20
MKKLLILPFSVWLVTTGLVQPLASQPTLPEERKLPAIIPVKPREPATSDDELRKLLVARYNSAVKQLEGRYNDFLTGMGALDIVVSVARRVTDSDLELADNPANQIAIREKLVDFLKTVEKLEQARLETQEIGLIDLEFTRYWRLDAEIQLLKAKRMVRGTK